MGGAGGGKGVAGPSHSGALVKRASPKSRDSQMRDCASEVRASRAGVFRAAGLEMAKFPLAERQ